jgi:hypothetical protein
MWRTLLILFGIYLYGKIKKDFPLDSIVYGVIIGLPMNIDSAPIFIIGVVSTHI